MKFNENVALLFTLLREALWRIKVSLPDKLDADETQAILDLAEKQSLSGLIMDALMRNNLVIPQERVFDSLGFVQLIKRSNWCVNMGVVAMHKLLTTENVDYAVVKGQAVASYYPDEFIRQSGDIDFYCNEHDFSKAMAAFRKEWGVAPKIHGSEKHADFRYNGNIYEGHFVLTNLHSKRRNDYLQALIDSDNGATIAIDGNDIKTLSPTIHTLYIFLHLFYHLIELGVGLRQFCDWAVMLHYCKQEINHEQLREHLKVLEMENAYKACGCILVDYLGVTEEELGYYLSEKDRLYGSRILDVVLYRGNMGHYNKIGGFSGWKHKLEAACIKLSHYVKLSSLAPSYSRGWIWHEIRTKLL